MRIYLSGSISNDPDYKNKFEFWENRLKKLYPDAEIFNPAAKGIKHIEDAKIILPEAVWHIYMIACLIKIIDYNYIFFIPDENPIESTGMQVESLFAEKLGIKELTIIDILEKEHDRSRNN